MPNITNGNPAPGREGAAARRLARLLDSPSLERVVPHLAPESLHRFVRDCGLDACVELVHAATPGQLTLLLDLDLWRRDGAGADWQFDVERFGEWVDVLVDAGESSAARVVATLDTETVIAGLSRFVRVFDPGTFEPTAQSDDEMPDRHDMMSSDDDAAGPEYEVGGYLVRARSTEIWDAIVSLLTALESEHANCFHALMRGCRRLSNSRPEVDGLDDLHMAPEQHGHDTALARERRRERQGYATPGDARSFLQMARMPQPIEDARLTRGVDRPIVTAYFHALDRDDRHVHAPGPRSTDASMPRLSGASSPDDGMFSPKNARAGVLDDEWDAAGRPRALIGGGDGDPRAAKRPYLIRLMENADTRDTAAYLAHTRELAFLANTLQAGCSVQSRPFTPAEASDAAACTCNLGLERWITGDWSGASSSRAPEVFRPGNDHEGISLIAAFEMGWSVLYRDVSLFVADRLALAIAGLDSVDADVRRGLYVLRGSLADHRASGTPWRARGAAEILAMLDMTAWVGVVGLLDECPIMPAAIAAVRDRRTTSVSATAFEFISTTAQIAEIREFMRRLPDLLSR